MGGVRLFARRLWRVRAHRFAPPARLYEPGGASEPARGHRRDRVQARRPARAQRRRLDGGEHSDERIQGLVLMAPHLFTEEAGLASIAEARLAYEAGDLRAKLAKYHAHVDIAFRGWNEAWLDPGFKAWNIEDVVGRWRVPALIIQGADDQYGTLAQVRSIEARSPAPVESLVLEVCRHSPQIDQPEATLKAIASFCAKLAKAEGAPS